LDLGTAHKGGITPVGFSTTSLIAALPSGSTVIGHNQPQVWAAGDEIRMSVRVEKA